VKPKRKCIDDVQKVESGKMIGLRARYVQLEIAIFNVQTYRLFLLARINQEVGLTGMITRKSDATGTRLFTG